MSRQSKRSWSGGSKVQPIANDNLWAQCLLYPHLDTANDISCHVDDAEAVEFGPVTNFSGSEQDFKQIIYDHITNRLKEAQVHSK